MALLTWHLRGRKAQLIPMNWNDKNESYDAKRQRILDKISSARSRDVVLIGESASGSLAVSLLSTISDKLKHVVTVCGYNHGAYDVNPAYVHAHPAFAEAVRRADRAAEKLSLEQRNTLTIVYSPADRVVRPEHTIISGSHLMQLGHLSHSRAIISQLLFPVYIHE